MYKIKGTTLTPTYRFDRSFTHKWYKKILWLLLVVAITLVFFYGASLYLFPNPEDFESDNGGDSQGRLMLLFRLLYDPSTVDRLTSGARIFGVIVVIVGMIIFMGMLISVASNILNSHIDKYERGNFDYKFDFHYIILGFNHSVPALIKKIRSDEKRKDNAILIFSDMPSNEIRQILHNELPEDDLDMVIIKNGQRTNREALESLNLHKAVEIWVMGEVNEFGHDPLNIKCTEMIADICGNNKEYKKRIGGTGKGNENAIAQTEAEYEARILVNVQFEEQSTMTAFQTVDVDKNWRHSIRFKACNYCDDWARKLIVERQYDGTKGKGNNKGLYPAIDAPNGVPTDFDSNKHVHLVIFGMTQMGLALAKRAAHHIHLPNFVRDSNLKTVITFIDTDADKNMNLFKYRYAQIFEIQSSIYYDFTQKEVGKQVFEPTKFTGAHADFLDVNYEFIKADIESPNVRNYLSKLADDPDTLLSIAVCYDDPNSNLNIALNLPFEVYYPKDESKVIPVFVRQFTCGNLVDILVDGRYRNFYPFGMWDGCNFEGEKEFELAKKVNYTYAKGENARFPQKSGDNYNTEEDKKLAEDMIKEWQIDSKGREKTYTDRWSSRYSADSISIKMRSMGHDGEKNFTLSDKEVEILARVEHNRWNMAQLLMGFYFDETLAADDKDKTKLLHNCIKPFDELKKGTQDYDRFIVKMMPKMI